MTYSSIPQNILTARHESDIIDIEMEEREMENREKILWTLFGMALMAPWVIL